MTITPAHPAEAAALTDIAFAAKRHWGYPERWITHWHALLTITPASIATHEIFAARAESHILGFGTLAHDQGILYLQDLWVLPSEMRRGIGRALFRHAQQRAHTRGFTTIDIESDPHATGFYQRMGAVLFDTYTTLLEGHPRELPILRCSCEHLD